MNPDNKQTSVFKLIYVLVIILATIIISDVVVVELMSGQKDAMRRRVHDYHQPAISTSLELDDVVNDTRLWLHADGLGSPGYPHKDYSTLTKRDVLIVMQKRISEVVDRIRHKQIRYKGPEFESLVKRLINQEDRVTNKIETLVENTDLPDFSFEGMVYGIHITSHQIRALHKVYYSRLVHEIKGLDKRLTVITRTVSLISAILALAVFFYMMRLIRNAISVRDKVSGRLQESDKRYQTLARVSPVGIFRTDEKGNCTYVNERWCELAGMNETQALGEGWAQALHPDDREQVFAAWYQAAADKIPFKMQCRFQRGDGKVTWLFAQADVELDAGGQMVGYVGTITDISELHYAEQQLRQSQENLAAIAENIKEGVAIYQDESIVYANRFMSEMLGYKDGSAVGMSLFEVVHPDYREEMESRYRDRMEGRAMLSNFQSVLLTRQGLPVEVEYTASATLWEGQLASLVAVRDITERKRIETALKAEHDLSQAILDSAGALILVVDAEGKIEQFNHMCEAVTYYDFEEVKGQYIWDVLFEKDEKDTITTIFNEIASGKAEDRYKLWITTKSREKRLIDWSSAMISNDDNGPQKVIGIGVDITERQMIEDRLFKSEHSLIKAQEISNTGNWIWDITNNTLEWSDQIYRIFGMKKKSYAVTYDDFLEAVHPDDRQKVGDSVLNHVADDTSPYNIEHRIVRPDGETRYVRELGEIIRDTEGNAIQMIGTVQDRTEQVQAQQALQQFKYTLDQTLDCVFMFDAESLRLFYTNEGAIKQVGYSREELLTMHPYDFKPEFSEQQFREMISPLISGEQSSLNFETIHRHKNGEHVPVEIFLQLIRQEGESSRFIAIVRDITERKVANEKLYETSRLLDNIVENVPNMIFLKRASDLSFKFFNRAGEELLGVDRSEMLGRNDCDFFPKDQADLFANKDREVLGQHGVVDIPEETIETSHGPRILHTQKIALRDEQGRPQYLLGISDDITDRVLAKESLKKSLAEKEVLLRELHHRVKNILQIISSLINMQSRKIKSKPAREAFIETRDRIRAVALIYEKLFGESNLSEIDVKQYIEYIAGRLDPVYEASKRGITTEIIGDAMILSMEKALPCGLIANELLTNVYKHAFPDGDPGHVRIELSVDDRAGYSITISDDGVGIDDRKKTGGSFGMEIMATLAGQLGGKLDIHGGIPGSQGTTTKLTFIV